MPYQIVALICITLGFSTSATAQTRPMGAVLSDRSTYEQIPYFAKDGLDLALPSRFVFPDLPVAGDQGRINSCTGWAVAYAAKTISYGLKHNDGEIEEFASYFSPGFLYGHTKLSSDCMSGANMADVLDFIALDGVVAYDTYAYTDHNCETPGPELKVAALSGRISNFGVVTKSWPTSQSDMQDLKVLLYNGFPIVLVIGVPESFHTWEKKDGSKVYTTKDFDFTGYHAVTIVGFDDTISAFKIINSWGRSWGTDGFAWIDYDTFREMNQETYMIFD